MSSIRARIVAHALDASTRSFDADGRLRVSRAVVTSACVSPYSGTEIPDADRLGLDARQVYNLLRPASELQAALTKFGNLPILDQHIIVSARDHKPDAVVGATGSNVRFDGTNVTVDLIIWAKDAIDAIESGECRELSMGYRYTPIRKSGVYHGVPYQIEMTDIVPNHLALVPEARVPGAMVGDALPPGMLLARQIRSRFTSPNRKKIAMDDDDDTNATDPTDHDLLTKVAKFCGEKGMKAEDIQELMQMLMPDDPGAAMDSRNRIMVAMDRARTIRQREYAAQTKSFDERFPGAGRLRVRG